MSLQHIGPGPRRRRLAAAAIALIVLTGLALTARPQPAAAASCPSPTASVSTASELRSALKTADPGDVIVLAAGRYAGGFSASRSGTAADPIMLCGPTEAILEESRGRVSGGTAFQLKGDYWHLRGFTAAWAKKGVMADGTVGSVIEGLRVIHIGDEGIHLRRNSHDNRVVGNTVSNTGERNPSYGEGIYIGSAQSNWCSLTGCNADRSDHNVIEGNTIHSTRAESIDVKEGTSSGVIRGNSFDGTGMTRAETWVDVKGNGWTIERNSGRDARKDGFQVHVERPGWGDGNLFRANTAAVNGPGRGFGIQHKLSNVVKCDNKVSGARGGFSNIRCTP